MKKLLLVLLIIRGTIAIAQNTMLTDFRGYSSFNGANPNQDQNLISVGGMLYGMAAQGGTNNLGTLFKIMPDGSGFTKLFDFVGLANGSSPQGSLIYDGTFLYGTTAAGGINNMGVIFKIKPDGTGYSKLLEFDGLANGKFPSHSLVSDGVFMYGMTQSGGAFDLGTIFKIKSDGTGFATLLDFSGAINGKQPRSSLTCDGTFLYGTTWAGGTNNMGTIFKIKTDGSGFAKLLDFDGTTNGSYPTGSLLTDGAFLYGMTPFGGNENLGILFKIKLDGSNFENLLNFTWGGLLGRHPEGSLMYDGSFLYGMTTSTIFKVKSDGSSYSILHGFVNGTEGSSLKSSLISVGGILYGMAHSGGINDIGTIFKIKPDGSDFSKLYDFLSATNGSNPRGSLISDGTYLYGMTSAGGTNTNCGTYGCGTIFKIKPDGTGFTKISDLEGVSNGSLPLGSLISDGTFLYGMTQEGGTNNLGTIFKIKPDGTGFTKLLDFAGSANGSIPVSTLISDGTFLYGMTKECGKSNLGTIFKIKHDGTGYSKLFDFEGDNGHFPHGSLISDGTFLYGMTTYGGTSLVNDWGTIFKIKPDGSNFTKLMEFINGATGIYPYGSFISYGNFLYGMTERTIFKISPDGSGYSEVFNFSSDNFGGHTYGSLISDGTFFYGTTVDGGSHGRGSVFKIKPDGSDYQKLLEFKGEVNGMNPYGSLILEGGFLYGTTALGGPPNIGTVFKISLNVMDIPEYNAQVYLKVYPIPFSLNTTIQTNKLLKHATLITYNSFGQIVKEIDNLSGNTITLNRDALTSGLYFIRLMQDNKVIATEKLVITDN